MKPSFLTLFTTLRCNNACRHCLYGCHPTSGSDMAWETFEKALRMALDQSITTINLFGGEPFLNPHLFPMLQSCLSHGFDLILATNGRILGEEAVYDQFLGVTRDHQPRIRVTIGNDEYHRVFFDPRPLGERLRADGYTVLLPEMSEGTLIITENNRNRVDPVKNRGNGVNCCAKGAYGSIGLLPHGAWTLCPPSLAEFGHIDTVSLGDLGRFKETVPLTPGLGCTACLGVIDQAHKVFAENGLAEVFPRDKGSDVGYPRIDTRRRRDGRHTAP